MNEQEKELIQDYKNLIQDYKLLTKDLRMLLSSVLGEEKEEENCNFVTLLKQPENEVNSPEFDEVKKGGRWQPIFGQRYFYLDDGGVIRCVEWHYDDEDKFHFNTGNCFKTEQEAEEYKENLLTKQQLKDLALELNNGVEIDRKDIEQEKYYIYFDHRTLNIQQTCVYLSHYLDVYCLNNQFLTIAKDRIGEEKLIKLIESGV